MILFHLAKISKSFGGSGGPVVLDDVTVAVSPGEAVGLVGESGSGKTTLVRCAMRLTRPDEGGVTYDGIDVWSATGADLMRFRREVQLVFQDPYSSLNPRMQVGDIITEGLLVHGIEPSARRRAERAAELLERVGLHADDARRLPRSFSGGQRQRIAIARALALNPRVLVCDEPVSALDVSVQAQIVNLLQDMQRELGVAILFIAHDLAVVRHLCSSITVLHRGKVAEQGSRDAIFDTPQNRYTRALLDAVQVPDPIVARARRAERQRALMADALL